MIDSNNLSEKIRILREQNFQVINLLYNPRQIAKLLFFHISNSYFLMSQSQSNSKKQTFERIRKQYPEKITDITSKQTLLNEWIKNQYLSQFHQIYHDETSISSPQYQKVIDQSDKVLQDVRINEKAFDSFFQEFIKIIVQKFQKNESTLEKYQFQQVEKIVQKTKLAFKQHIKIKSKPSSKSVLNNQSNSPQISQMNKTLQKKSQPIKQSKPQPQQPNRKLIHQTSHRHAQNFAKSNVQSKPNSLFVQKQKPISEENIFKGQNFRRPSSRLKNQKLENLMSQKPKSQTKSNKSKRSRVSSKSNQIEKKSQQLAEPKQSIKQFEKIQQNKAEVVHYDRSEEEPKHHQIDSDHQNNKTEGQDNISKEQSLPEEQIKKKQIIFDQNDSSFHLPTFKLSKESPNHKKNPIQSILSNPFIKKAFTHLCKQSYIGGGKTFDQIAQSADIMTLNKWMVFCKQFDFVSKLKKKLLVDIFKQCTNNKPHMNQKQFLNALIIVQSKMKVQEEDFIRKQICLDSQFAFREKVAAFKVNFSGPKVNFFEQSTIKPLDKYYQNLRQQKYHTEKQKQKQFILHQGKFKQDIEGQLNQRKHLRYLQKSHIINSSLTDHNDIRDNQIYKRPQAYALNSPYLKYVQNKSHIQNNYSSVKNNYELGLSKLSMSRRMQPLNYSQIFTQKNSISTRSFTNDKSIVQKSQNSASKNLTQLRKTKHTKTLSERQKTQKKDSRNTNQGQISKENSSSKTPQLKPQKMQQTKPSRQWNIQIKNWAEQFDKSQSEESDEILREHLVNERLKMKNLPEKMNLSRIVQEFQKDEKWLQKQNFEEHSEWQRQTQLQTQRI